MYIRELIIEVTRRCNMACGHCMRGDAQAVDMTRETMAKLLEGNDIDQIGTVTFTGGEPSLNVQAIRDFMDICRANGIEVGGFYIATNGKRISEEFIHVLMDLYMFCSDNEMSAVEVSRSIWHQNEGQDEYDIERLMILRFARERNNLNPYDKDTRIINQGRGKEFNEAHGFEGKDLTYTPDVLNLEDESVYVNVHGDILPDCDMSYETQEELKLGNVYQDKLVDLVDQEVEA